MDVATPASTEVVALERRLLRRRLPGAADDSWLLARRRVALADEARGTDGEKQHLAIASLLGSKRSLRAVRDPARLAAYPETFERAAIAGCLPSDLRRAWLLALSHENH